MPSHCKNVLLLNTINTRISPTFNGVANFSQHFRNMNKPNIAKQSHSTRETTGEC